MVEIGFGWRRVVPFLVVLGLFSCVTVNIYFPAEDVRRAAEEIVGEVRRQPQDTEQRSLPPQSGNHPVRSPEQSLGSVSLGPLSFGVPAAHAQSETRVSNAAIRAIKERLKARQPQLSPYYASGAIGETNSGALEIRDSGALDMRSKAVLKRLVDAENEDRRQLYQEVARAMNIDPGQLRQVESIFAEEWQKSAGAGWYIQKPDGQWVRK